jgi:hypothetical protein
MINPIIFTRTRRLLTSTGGGTGTFRGRSGRADDASRRQGCTHLAMAGPDVADSVGCVDTAAAGVASRPEEVVLRGCTGQVSIYPPEAVAQLLTEI